MYNEFQKIMKNHGIYLDRDELEETFDAVGSILYAIADNLRENMPWAWRTIEEFESAAHCCGNIMDYVEDENDDQTEDR